MAKKELVYLDDSGCTIKLPIDVMFDRRTLKFMLELDELAKGNKLNDDPASVVDMVKYIYCSVLYFGGGFENSRPGIINFTKELQASNTKIDPVLKTLLAEILSDVISSNKPVYKGFCLVKPNSEMIKVPFDIKINHFPDITSVIDELNILFAKHSLLEMVDMVIALKRVAYNVIYNEAISSKTFGQ